MKDIVVRRNLAVEHAVVPTVPSDADYTGGRVRVVLTVRKGAVTRARVLGKTDANLAREALSNVKTWRFSSLLSTRITTVFEYRVETAEGCPPSNPQVVLNLPWSVVVTRWRRLPCRRSIDRHGHPGYFRH